MKSQIKKWPNMKCDYFIHSKCSSCNLLNLEYKKTIELKESHLESLFNGVDLKLKPSIGLNDHVEHSRNKAKLAAYNGIEEIEFGYYDKDQSFHELEDCPLHSEGINDIVKVIKEILPLYKINAYDLKEKKGELKYLILSKSISHNDYLIRFILRSKESLDRLKKLSVELKNQYPQIKVITANIQPEHMAILEGPEEICLTSEDSIVHVYEDVHLFLGARSFFQVTPEIAQKLYGRIGEIVLQEKIDSFLDLYCGVGAFSFFAARYAKEVVGVEISPEAIEFAKKSRGANKIKGSLEFYAQDVNAFLKGDISHANAVMVNPPRRGLSSEIIGNIKSLKPQYIFYSSCNAESLKRDYDELKESYQIVESQIFDMFPFTNHYETLIILKIK